MNKSILTGLGAMVFVATLVGGAASAAADLAQASARYPNSRQVVSERISLGSLRQPRLSEEGEYLTGDALMTVAAWYVGRYHLEPDDALMTVAAWYAGSYHLEPVHGMLAQGQCMRLTNVIGYYVLRQMVVVTLCPLSHGTGTQVFFNQTVYLGQ